MAGGDMSYQDCGSIVRSEGAKSSGLFDPYQSLNQSYTLAFITNSTSMCVEKHNTVNSNQSFQAIKEQRVREA